MGQICKSSIELSRHNQNDPTKPKISIGTSFVSIALALSGIISNANKLEAQQTTDNQSVTNQTSSVKIQKLKVDQAMFSAAAKYEASRSRKDYVAPLLLAEINKFQSDPYKNRGSVESLNELNRQVATIDKMIQEANRRGEDFSIADLTEGMTSIGKSIPNPKVSITSAVLAELIKPMNKDIENADKSSRQLMAQINLASASKSFQNANTQEAWEQIWDYANENPEFARSADVFLRSTLYLSPKQSSEEILQNLPEFRDVHLILRKILIQNEATVAELEDIQRVITTDLGLTLKELRKITKSSMSSIDQAELNNIKIQSLMEKREIAVATVNLTTSFMRIFGDEEMQKQAQNFQAIGQAYIGLHDALTNFNLDPSNKGAFILSGDILSIGVNLASSLFGIKSANQLILEQIYQLREELNAFRNETREYFLVIDSKLDMVFSTLVNGFDEIHSILVDNKRSLENVNTKLEAVILSFVELERQILNSEQHIFEYIEAGFEREHSKAIKEFIEFEDRFAQQITLEKWQEGLTYFATRALYSSSDALNIGPVVQGIADVSNKSAYHRLKNSTSPRELDFLAHVANLRFGNSDILSNDGRIPNLSEWYAACDYYLKLIDLAPEYLVILEEKDLNDMIRLGKVLQNSIKNIKTINSEDRVKTRADFLNSIVENYENQLNQLKLITGKIVSHFEEDWLSGIKLEDPYAVSHLKYKMPPLLDGPGFLKNMPPLPVVSEMLPHDVIRLDLLLKANNGPGLDLDFRYNSDWFHIGEEEKAHTLVTCNISSALNPLIVDSVHRWTEKVKKGKPRLYVIVSDGNARLILEYHCNPSETLVYERTISDMVKDKGGPYGMIHLVREEGETSQEVIKRNYPDAIINGDLVERGLRIKEFYRPDEVGVLLDNLVELQKGWKEIESSKLSDWKHHKDPNFQLFSSGKEALDISSNLEWYRLRADRLIFDRVSSFEKELMDIILSLGMGTELSPTMLRAEDVTELKNCLEELSGAKMLLENYLVLGMSKTTSGDQLFASALLGDNEIIDLGNIGNTILKYKTENQAKSNQQANRTKRQLLMTADIGNTIKEPQNVYQLSANNTDLEGLLILETNVLDFFTKENSPIYERFSRLNKALQDRLHDLLNNESMDPIEEKHPAVEHMLARLMTALEELRNKKIKNQ